MVVVELPILENDVSLTVNALVRSPPRDDSLGVFLVPRHPSLCDHLLNALTRGRTRQIRHPDSVVLLRNAETTIRGLHYAGIPVFAYCVLEFGKKPLNTFGGVNNFCGLEFCDFVEHPCHPYSTGISIQRQLTTSLASMHIGSCGNRRFGAYCCPNLRGGIFPNAAWLPRTSSSCAVDHS